MTAFVRIPRQSRGPFLEEMARLLDIGDTFSRHKRFDSGPEADMFALQGDWERICEDYRIATKAFLAEVEGIKGFDAAQSKQEGQSGRSHRKST